MTDQLTPLAHDIIKAATYDKLVVSEGTPARAHKLLANVTPDQLLSVPIKSAGQGNALMAGLWLRHDALDESHKISQALANPTGSFWHAIMHRREGDFSNSKYWYARAGNHPVLTTLAHQAGSIVNHLAADNQILRIVSDGWNSNALVDLVEAVESGSDESRGAAVQLQQLEWELLFEHCARE